MNKHQTEQAIEVMIAYFNGEQVQSSLRHGPWFDCEEPTWDWRTFKFRVKPQPKTMYVNEYDDGSGCCFDNEHDAVTNTQDFQAVRVAVKYVEVVED